MIVEKFVEIRDAATKIPALAFSIQPASPAEYALMRAAGYPRDPKELYPMVFLMKLDGLETRHEPYGWSAGSRTMKYAHLALTGDLLRSVVDETWPVARRAEVIARLMSATFDSIVSGEVLDVEYLMGLTDDKKLAEAIACPVCFGRRVVTPEIGREGTDHICFACTGTGRRVFVASTGDEPAPTKPKKKKGGR